jgi:thiol-disulfide isomerase/thioredoxin
MVGIGSLAFGQDAVKKDSIPPDWYGAWHAKGNMDSPVLTLHKSTAHCKGEPYYYRGITKTAEGYQIKAYSQTDSMLLDVSMKGPNQLHVKGYPLEEADLWETWKENGAKSLDYKDLPPMIRHKWYYKVKEAGYYPFHIEEKGISAQSMTPFIPDEILMQGGTYRILTNTGQGKFYFFLRAPERHYMDIATGTGAYQTYTSHYELPAVRPDNPELLPAGFWNPWMMTDTIGKVLIIPGRETWTVDGKAYQMAHLRQSGDTLRFRLLNEPTLAEAYITNLNDKYIRWHWLNNPPVILKSSAALPNGYQKSWQQVPGKFFGYWYATDGTNSLALSLEAAGLKVLGVAVKDPLIYENLGIWHMEYGSKKSPAHLVIRPLNFEYLLVTLTGHAPMLLKHDRELPDRLTLTPAEIPESFTANWFSTIRQNDYFCTLSREWFIFRGAFYTYSDIKLGAGELQFTAVNETNSCKVVVEENNGRFRIAVDNYPPVVVRPERIMSMPGQGESTPYPEFKYVKGGKFIVNGYLLNHERYPKFATILFYWSPVIGGSQKQQTVTPGPDGRFRLEIDLDHACEIQGHYGQGFLKFFGAPGHENLMVMNALDYTERGLPATSLAVAGPWAEEIYLCTDFFRNFLDIQPMESHRDHIRDDDSTAYKAYRLKMYKSELAQLDSFCSSVTYSPFFRKWAETRVTFSWYNDLMRFRWLKNSYNAVRTPNDYPVSTGWLEWQAYLPIDKNLVFNTEVAQVFHEHRMYNETKAMIDFYPKWPYLSLPKDENGKELSKSGYYEAFWKRVDKGYAPFMRDVMTALFYEGAFARESMEILDPVVTDYQAKSVTPWASDFLSDSYQTFKKYGKAGAPEPKSAKPVVADTSKMSLWDKLIYPHRGKVIYVDFWATWCGPCVSQFPYSKELHQALEGKDVVFMYLCGGGSKKPAWGAMVEKYGLKGDHHLLDDKEWGEVTNKFKISGIPHYVLVDPSGQVADKAAQRPQGGNGYNQDLMKEILGLMKK